jgi:hypothetical protein
LIREKDLVATDWFDGGSFATGRLHLKCLNSDLQSKLEMEEEEEDYDAQEESQLYAWRRKIWHPNADPDDDDIEELEGTSEYRILHTQTDAEYKVARQALTHAIGNHSLYVGKEETYWRFCTNIVAADL